MATTSTAVEYDLIHDIERQGRNVLEVFRTLFGVGEILDCEVNFEAVGTLDDSDREPVPLQVILVDGVQAGRHRWRLFPHNRDKSKLLDLSSKRAAAVQPEG